MKKKFGYARVVALIALVFILSVLPTVTIISIKRNVVKEKFFGKESDLQGVLVVWNIDTFEGGTGAKSQFIEKIGLSFEKVNKGLYILVKNMSVEELENELQAGKMPDIFSFGNGIGNVLLPHLENLSIKLPILQNVQESATVDGETKAAAWTLGGYFLLSTPEAMEKAKVEGSNLLNLVFSAGYQKKVGKKIQDIPSVTWGVSNYHTAEHSLSKYIQIKEDKIDTKAKKQTAYEAYVKFFAGKATILAGTHRDVARFENKLSQGIISGILFKPLTKQTDLVQYIGIAKQEDTLRKEYAEKFIEFLLSKENQSQLSSIGMFAADGQKLYEKGALFEYEKELLKVEVPKLFG